MIIYLIGSIPFGLILTKIFTKTDIRKIGSGNIGATNVLRTGNKVLAAFTLFLDFLKGFIAISLGEFFMRYFVNCEVYEGVENCESCGPCTPIDPSHFVIFFGLAGILGHCFPVWLKFKGGKGVATTFGVLLATVPWAGFVAVCTWGIVAGFFRYSSLSALCAVAIAPLATFLIYGSTPAVITVLIAVLVIWRHKENIKRLMAGDEPKIFENKDAKPADTE